MESSFLGFFPGWKKKKPSQKYPALETEATNRLQLILSSQGRGERDTLLDWRLPQREEQEQGITHHAVLMVASKSPWLCKPIRAGTRQGDGIGEYVKLGPASGTMDTNVGAIAQTWDEPEDTDQCLQDLL